jgi:hypothetical protein
MYPELNKTNFYLMDKLVTKDTTAQGKGTDLN